MNRLRFGALLVDDEDHLGFYLSHRMVLTVLERGPVRAMSMKDFRPSAVFTVGAVAVAFFDGLAKAVESREIFENSLEMVKNLAGLTEIQDFDDLNMVLKERHGAELVDFTVPVPQVENENSTQEITMDESEVVNEFNEKYKEARGKFGKRPNILVCGYTGSGKTSLVKAILGDVVPDDAVGDGRPKTMGYDCYENELVRIWDSKGLENGEAEEVFTAHTRDFVREKQRDPDVDNHIHLVWYTIQGSGARVTDCDLNLIHNIFNPEHVIVVVTKNDATRPRQKDALLDALRDAGVPRQRIVFTSDEESGAVGCKELMRLSYEMLPEAYRDAFMEAQRIDMEARIEAIRDKATKAKAIVATAIAAASAAGAIPIPLSDAAVLVPIQITMIATLAGLYGLREEAVKQAALPFVAKMVGMFAANSILKLVPGLGSVVNATVAGALTGAMGRFVRCAFEEAAIAKVEGRPVPPLLFDVELFRKFYEQYGKQK